MNARTPALALILIACHSLVYAQFSETVEVRITHVEAVVVDSEDELVGMVEEHLGVAL